MRKIAKFFQRNLRKIAKSFSRNMRKIAKCLLFFAFGCKLFG